MITGYSALTMASQTPPPCTKKIFSATPNQAKALPESHLTKHRTRCNLFHKSRSVIEESCQLSTVSMSKPQVRTGSSKRQTLRLDKNSSFSQILFAKGRPVNSKGSKRYRASKSIPFAYRSSLRNRNDSSILF